MLSIYYKTLDHSLALLYRHSSGWPTTTSTPPQKSQQSRIGLKITRVLRLTFCISESQFYNFIIRFAKNSFIKLKSWSTFGRRWWRMSEDRVRGNLCSHLINGDGYANLILIYSISIGRLSWRTCSCPIVGHKKSISKCKSSYVYKCLMVVLPFGKIYISMKKNPAET